MLRGVGAPWGTLVKRLDPLESPTVFCSAYKGNMLKKAGW